MSIDAVKATTSDVNSSGDFSLSEWLKKVKDGMKKWANFDEQKQRGSLVGKVFTGGYVLIFGWVISKCNEIKGFDTNDAMHCVFSYSFIL